MWVDKARSIVTPVLERLVVVRGNLDTESTHQRILAGELFQFGNLPAVVRHVRVERVVRCNESSCISALDEVVQSCLVWSGRCLANVPC